MESGKCCTNSKGLQASGSNELIWSNSGLRRQKQKQWMYSSLVVACAMKLSHSSKILIMMKLVTDHEITIGPTPHPTTVLRPFFQNHPGEPVPEEICGLYGARED